MVKYILKWKYNFLKLSCSYFGFHFQVILTYSPFHCDRLYIVFSMSFHSEETVTYFLLSKKQQICNVDWHGSLLYFFLYVSLYKMAPKEIFNFEFLSVNSKDWFIYSIDSSIYKSFSLFIRNYLFSFPINYSYCWLVLP